MTKTCRWYARGAYAYCADCGQYLGPVNEQDPALIDQGYSYYLDGPIGEEL